MDKSRKFTVVFSTLVGIYIALSQVIPLDPKIVSKYNVPLSQLRLINLLVVLTITIIWYIAFYGFIKLYEYATTIKKTYDGEHFMTMANGLKWLAFGFPLRSAISSVLNFILRYHPTLKPAIVIFNNYLTVILALIAFVLLSRGAAGLARVAQKKANAAEQHYWVMLFIFLSVLYTYFVVLRPIDRAERSLVYHLPDWLILTTLVIPYLYAWYRGIVAAYHMYFYRKNINGTVYKQALGYLSAGLVGVIVTSLMYQVLLTISSGLNRLNLTPLLKIIYVILLVIALGHILIALGARRLRKIEEA